MIHYMIATHSVAEVNDISANIYEEEIFSSFPLPARCLGVGMILEADGSGYPDRRIISVNIARS